MDRKRKKAVEKQGEMSEEGIASDISFVLCENIFWGIIWDKVIDSTPHQMLVGVECTESENGGTHEKNRNVDQRR